MLALFFFLSGFASILYQIVWLRLAMGHFGVIAPVLSTVLSVFMLGLALGAWLSGRWLTSTVCRSLSPARLLAVYGLCEGVAALGSRSVPSLFNLVETSLLHSGMESHVYWVGLTLGIAGSLIIPCTLLGATTPIILAYMKSCGQSTEHSFSRLYFANLIGAIASALATPYVLIECLGFQKTLALGIVIQSVVSLWALAVSLSRRIPARPSDLPDEPGRAMSSDRGVSFALTALAVTGFVSMASEVIWTRTFTPVLGTTIYAFAGILAVYLIFHALGVAAYRLAAMSARDNVGWIWAIGLLPLSAMLPLLVNDTRWGSTDVRVVTVLGSITLFCALLGWLTPGWVDRYSQGDPRRAGFAYAINVLGCILGPLAAGYILLPQLGAQNSLIVLGMVLLGLSVMVLWQERHSVRTHSMLFLSAVAVVSAIWTTNPETPGPSTRFETRRDYMATVISNGDGMAKRLFVNGVGITDMTVLTKIMAHLPIMSHGGTPQSALMICFGMGTTYRSLLSWNLQTTAVELVPSVRDAFGYYFSDAADVLRRPEGRIVIDDGRRYLKRSPERYDIITLDPPPPVEAAASGFLYSREFYGDVKSRLAPGGVIQQWWPGGDRAILQSVARTFGESFRYVRVYRGLGQNGFHFLGSETPLRPLHDKDVTRMSATARRDFLEWCPQYQPMDLWRLTIGHEVLLPTLINPAVPILTDDRPYNEYFLLRRWQQHRKGTFETIF